MEVVFVAGLSRWLLTASALLLGSLLVVNLLDVAHPRKPTQR
jgi:hypothetical protein